jgi:hypothetical protein
MSLVTDYALRPIDDKEMMAVIPRKYWQEYRRLDEAMQIFLFHNPSPTSTSRCA